MAVARHGEATDWPAVSRPAERVRSDVRYGSLGDLSKGEEALRAYERSLRAAGAALRLNPASLRGLRGRAIATYKVGDAAFKLGRFESALAQSK